MATSQQPAVSNVTAPARAAEGAGGNVLCVANFPSDTGYAWWLMEHFWIRIAEFARQQGGSAVVAFPRVSGVSAALREAALPVVELSVPTSLPAPLGQLREFIRAQHIRTVYFTDRHYWSPLYTLFRLWGVQQIIVHDHIPGERPRPPRWKLLAKRLRYLLPGSGADLYIGVSDFVCRRMREVAGAPAGRCKTVHNGVPAMPREKADVRTAFGLPATARVVVSTGRANRYKGIDFLIRSAARMVRDGGYDDVYFVHFGAGPELDKLRAQVRAHELDDRFILAGARSDLTSMLESCTVALHASHGEAFSLAILEFMAAGLPAVVPDHCGNGEAIEHGANGVLYRSGDLDTAVGWLRRLLDDASLRHRLGAAARVRAHHHFSLAAMDANFAAVLQPHIRT